MCSARLFYDQKKFRTELSIQLLSIILDYGALIDVSENDEELLCDNIDQIKYIEALKCLLSNRFCPVENIRHFLYEQLDSSVLSNNEKTIFQFPSTESILSFKYWEYDSKSFWEKIPKKKYLLFLDNLKNNGLLACSELLKCIRYFTYENMLKYAKNLSSASYCKELLQVFGEKCVFLSKNAFPALVLTRRYFTRKDHIDLVGIVKSSFPNKTKRMFNTITEIDDALNLYKAKLPCSIIAHNIDNIDSWSESFNNLRRHLLDKTDPETYEILAFVFSSIQWSCQHGAKKVKYDQIIEKLKPYKKELYEILFKYYNTSVDQDKIYILNYIFASSPSECINELKNLSTKIYDYFPKYLSQQINIEADKNESFLSSESYRTMLHFLNSFTFSGAIEYWEFFVKTFLLVRNSKDFILSFSFSSAPNEKEDSFKILYIIDLIKTWFKDSEREGMTKTTAIEIIETIERTEKENKPILLHLVINYLIYNFGKNKDFSLSLLLTEILKQIQKDEYYLARIKVCNYLEEYLKNNV